MFATRNVLKSLRLSSMLIARGINRMWLRRINIQRDRKHGLASEAFLLLAPIHAAPYRVNSAMCQSLARPATSSAQGVQMKLDRNQLPPCLAHDEGKSHRRDWGVELFASTLSTSSKSVKQYTIASRPVRSSGLATRLAPARRQLALPCARAAAKRDNSRQLALMFMEVSVANLRRTRMARQAPHSTIRCPVIRIRVAKPP